MTSPDPNAGEINTILRLNGTNIVGSGGAFNTPTVLATIPQGLSGGAIFDVPAGTNTLDLFNISPVGATFFNSPTYFSAVSIRIFQLA